MISDIVANTKIKELQLFFKQYDKIVIVAHVSPDGDAIGSSIGLYHYLHDLGKDVRIVVPNDFPDFLKWMRDADAIVKLDADVVLAEKLIAEAQLICCLDFNTPKRMSDLAPLVQKSVAKKVLIDHHPYPEDFCDLTISYPQLSSTSELIFRLIYGMGELDNMSYDSASAIYSGMMTDTGSFTYNSNNPDIYYIISELLRKGINKDEIYANVYNNYSESRFRLMGFALSQKMKIYKEYNTAVITLSSAEMQSYGIVKGDTEGFVNIPLSIKGIVFSIFIKEGEKHTKISLRSRGTFPANKFSSEYFNGGGHLNAAGGEYHGTVDEAVAVVEKALPKYKDQLTMKIK